MLVSPAIADDDNRAGYFLAPKAFRSAMTKVMPSVVTIETYGGIVARPKKGGRGQMRGISKPGEGPTTGVIVSPDGYIITSTYNFIRKPAIITVILDDGSQHVARLLGRDDTRKICLLKIDGVKDLPVPPAAPVDSLRVGQWSVSVGVGYGGDDPAMSVGIISARNRIFGKAVQTDANTSPANYGGPLIDIEGRVIGICVPLSPRSGQTAAGVEWYDSGIGFAVPLDGADRLIDQMKKGKVIVPGRIGVMPKPVKGGKGVGINKVVENSPGAKAGIKANDVIIAVNGEAILDMMQLRSKLGRYVAGDTIKLTIKRGDKEMELEVTLSKGTDVPAPKRPTPPGKKKK